MQSHNTHAGSCGLNENAELSQLILILYQGGQRENVTLERSLTTKQNLAFVAVGKAISE